MQMTKRKRTKAREWWVLVDSRSGYPVSVLFGTRSGAKDYLQVFFNPNRARIIKVREVKR